MMFDCADSDPTQVHQGSASHGCSRSFQPFDFRTFHIPLTTCAFPLALVRDHDFARKHVNSQLRARRRRRREFTSVQRTCIPSGPAHENALRSSSLRNSSLESIRRSSGPREGSPCSYQSLHDCSRLLRDYSRCVVVSTLFLLSLLVCFPSVVHLRHGCALHLPFRSRELHKHASDARPRSLAFQCVSTLIVYMSFSSQFKTVFLGDKCNSAIRRAPGSCRAGGLVVRDRGACYGVRRVGKIKPSCSRPS